jgi:hypothetical protein
MVALRQRLFRRAHYQLSESAFVACTQTASAASQREEPCIVPVVLLWRSGGARVAPACKVCHAHSVRSTGTHGACQHAANLCDNLLRVQMCRALLYELPRVWCWGVRCWCSAAHGLLPQRGAAPGRAWCMACMHLRLSRSRLLRMTFVMSIMRMMLLLMSLH